LQYAGLKPGVFVRREKSMGSNQTDVNVSSAIPPIKTATAEDVASGRINLATLADKYAQARQALRDLLNYFDHPDVGQWTATDTERLKEIRAIAGQSDEPQPIVGSALPEQAVAGE
jgi:hypothetical protein